MKFLMHKHASALRVALVVLVGGALGASALMVSTGHATSPLSSQSPTGDGAAEEPLVENHVSPLSDRTAYMVFRSAVMEHLADYDEVLVAASALINSVADGSISDELATERLREFQEYYAAKAEETPAIEFAAPHNVAEAKAIATNLKQANAFMMTSMKTMGGFLKGVDSMAAVWAKQDTTRSYTHYRQVKAALFRLDDHFGIARPASKTRKPPSLQVAPGISFEGTPGHVAGMEMGLAGGLTVDITHVMAGYGCREEVEGCVPLAPGIDPSTPMRRRP